jgi:hypothetical protein
MAKQEYAVLWQGLVGVVSDGLLVACPPTERWTILTLWITNNDTTARTMSLNLVAPSQTAGVANRLLPDLRLAATDKTIIESRWLVPPSWRLMGDASAGNVVAMHLFGIKEVA